MARLFGFLLSLLGYLLSYMLMRVSMAVEGGRHGPLIQSGVTRAGGGGDKRRGKIPIVFDVQGTFGLFVCFWGGVSRDSSTIVSEMKFDDAGNTNIIGRFTEDKAR